MFGFAQFHFCHHAGGRDDDGHDDGLPGAERRDPEHGRTGEHAAEGADERALDRAVGVEAQGLAAEEGAGDARGEVAHEYDEQEEEEQQRTGRVVAR